MGNLEYEYCEDAESVLNDVTCKKTVEFQCRKEKRVDGGYGKETVCERIPRENCYDTPRTVRNQLCRPQTQRYCQKFSNPFPLPLEKQNCHFEPKKICEEADKQYCYKEEVVTTERICDKKFSYESL